LRETGVLPELTRTTTTQQPVLASAFYQLQAEAGLVSAGQADGMLSGAQCLALQAALDHHEGAALRAACANALPVLKSQLRPVLHYHLGSPPLRTRQMMLDLRRLLDGLPSPPAKPTAQPTAPSGLP
jgi:DNA repair protein RecO (recombination protein O)